MGQVRYWAVIPAAGTGSRMGARVPKQYLPLAGKRVIEHSLERLGNHPDISGVVVVLAANDPYWRQITPTCAVPLFTVTGGAERFHSVLNGLDRLTELAAPDDWVLVHDAARPCLRLADMDLLMRALADHPVGGLLAIPVTDTVKRADASGTVLETVARDGLWRALTPQMFRLGALHAALSTALRHGRQVTDEAAAMELAAASPRLVRGHDDNIKITSPDDLITAELYLQRSDLSTHGHGVGAGAPLGTGDGEAP
jgi:2-C-methyl-D-erythritol 4-phosphate cytidylyltransferase